MYELRDTIVAVSSPSCDKRVIIRITGPDTVETCKRIFISPITKNKSGIVCGSVSVDDELSIDTQLYLFFAPHSYTGEDTVEIHIDTNAAVTEVLIDGLLGRGLRMAGPGEFTARAYLNGKIDLAQAEAVNEIIVSSNAFQLDAAEKLLSGRLSETTAKVRSAIVDCLSLIEAGLDFSTEDIEPESGAEVIERLLGVKGQLEELLSGSIRYESLIDLPAVGITGAPNAGKSSLLNKLLGKERSIVSHKRKTTRDVLSAAYSLSHCRCVLFDCAGLMIRPEDVLDELAQLAAVEALRNSAVVVFCIDISKADFSEEVSIGELIEPQILLPVATKCDLVSEKVLSSRLAELNELFGSELLAISSETGAGLEVLRETIDGKILEMEPGFATSKTAGTPFSEGVESSVALTARHKQAVTEAIENVGESIGELKAGNDEVAAMILRGAYQAVSGIESAAGGHIDEQILEQIFSRFCIGK
ncbi:MAG: GTP-binding protein [Planctomycetes bacterium]|nr:GTP-binding protein [Planctomycetota bacterium]